MTYPTTSEVLSKLRAGEAPPMAAMRVFGAPVELSAEGNSPDAKTIKVRLKARQRGAINHWYFGPIYHDLSTMRHRAKIALDDTHDVEIGYGRPVQTEYGLEIDGVVVTNPENPQHEANRIAYNLRNGIPQEASIDFTDEYDLLELPEGQQMEVNGMTAEGPALVVRNWTLRACAICKEGADSSTQTSLLTNGSALAPLPRSITQFTATPKEPMQETSSAVPPTLTPPAEPVPANPTPAAEPAPVAPVLTQAPVEPPKPDQTAELEAVRTELAKVHTQLAEVTQAREQLQSEVNTLNARITTLTAGVPPVPQPVTAEPATWSAAIAIVMKEHPHYAEWQAHDEASKRFPNVLSKINKPK